MQTKNEYLDTVSDQIKFRAARKTLRRELETHIDEKADELLQKGEKDAEQLAVAAMGDAVQTGKAMNAVHRPRIEWRVILCMLLLSAISAIISVTMTQYGSYVLPQSLYSEIISPMIRAFILMVALYFLNYKLWGHLRYMFFAAGMFYIVAYILTYQPNNWQSILFCQTPVIILTTLLFILGIIGIVSHGFKNRVLDLAVLSLLSIVSIVVLCMVTSANAFVLCFVYAAVFVTAKWKQRKQLWKDMIIYTAILVVGFVICTQIFTQGKYAFNVGIDVYRYDISLDDALQKARFIGPSTRNIGWDLPGSRTNYVITSVICAYGWLAGMGVAAVSCAMCVFMLKQSLRISHSYGRLLATGISVYFAIRFIMLFMTNVGLMGGSFSLPFISYGRVEYFADAILLGIFLSVWRRSTFMKDEIKAVRNVSAAGI